MSGQRNMTRRELLAGAGGRLEPLGEHGGQDREPGQQARDDVSRGGPGRVAGERLAAIEVRAVNDHERPAEGEAEDRLPDGGEHDRAGELAGLELQQVPAHPLEGPRQRHRADDEHQQHHEQRRHDEAAGLLDPRAQPQEQHDDAAEDHQRRAGELQQERACHEAVIRPPAL